MRKGIILTSFTAVIMLFAVTLSACGGDKKTDLSIPENVRIDEADFTLKWNTVTNAAGYTVDIDGTTETVTDTAYPLKRLTTEHKVYKIKIKATTSDSEKYNDSAYSAELECEPAEYIFVYGGAEQRSAQTGLRLAAPMAETTDGLIITGLTNYGKTLDNIIIPAQIGTTEVKAIGGGAFENNTAVTAVVIPATVIAVEQNAFKGCAALTAVTFRRTGADGVTSLESGVFDGCAALKNIIVPQDSANAYKEIISEVAPSIADKVTEKADGEYEDMLLMPLLVALGADNGDVTTAQTWQQLLPIFGRFASETQTQSFTPPLSERLSQQQTSERTVFNR